jgi:hypothetical protein
MQQTQFKFGDKVVHALRPEWGAAAVSLVQQVTVDGRPAQRLTLRFERAGLKVVSVPPAEIQLADSDPDATPPAGGSPDESWLAQLEAGDINERMASLPESTRDPFTTLAARIKATLALWRFSEQGGSVLDWAAMQTGLKDPLARFSRHELEQFFRRFASERENQLKRLLLEARKHPSPEIDQAKAAALPAAKDAMRRMHL